MKRKWRKICAGWFVLLHIMTLTMQANAQETVFETQWMNGDAYVKAEDLPSLLGGSGTFSADGSEYTYNSTNMLQGIEHISPSVVAILGRPYMEQDAIESGRFELSHGSGVIVREDGWIVTNAHVVNELSDMLVVTSDGKKLSARLIAMDEDSDLALIRVNALGLKAATLSTSNPVVGESVAAIGTPISFALRNSAAVGVISGIDRSVNATYQLIQTDAAINPGNSGGPLINSEGEVVGINSMKYAAQDIDNLGFAIPASTVSYVMEHLMKYGTVQRPYFGAVLEESWATIVGLPGSEPLVVEYVKEGSPASAAGLLEGDKVLSLDDVAFTTLVEFNELLKAYVPGKQATLKVDRDGKILELQLTFGNDPDQVARVNTSDERFVDIWTQSGNPEYLINGEQYQLPSPIVNDGVTLVPIELFALAYGVSNSWELEGGQLRFTFGTDQVIMNIGQRDAKWNGESIQLPASPMIQGDQPLVPFRYVAESLGMELDYYRHSGETLISGYLDDHGQFINNANFDTDKDKTSIGNSHFGWSIRYPASLVLTYQAEDGSWVDFSEAGGSYSLSISVEENQDAALTDQQLFNEIISSSYSSKVLSKQVMEDAEKHYVKVTMKGVGYEEHRAYYNDAYIYYVSLYVEDESYMKDDLKHEMLQRLLDSFEMQFDASDASVKDLSPYNESGMMQYHLHDYGVTFELPSNWSDDYWSDDIIYGNDDDWNEDLRIRVTSIEAGDTLEAWVQRQDEQFADRYHEDYIKKPAHQELNISGFPAIMSEYQFTMDLENWVILNTIYVIADDYKYQFTFNFGGWIGTDRSDEEREGLVEDFIDSLVINPDQMDVFLGDIEDEDDFVDKTEVRTVSSEEYGYSFEVPAYWEADSAYNTYYSFAVYLSVDVNDEIILEEKAEELLESYFVSYSYNSRDIAEDKKTMMDGHAARWLTAEFEDEDGHKGTERHLMIEKDGYTYTLSAVIYDAVKNEENLGWIERFFDSFELE